MQSKQTAWALLALVAAGVSAVYLLTPTRHYVQVEKGVKYRSTISFPPSAAGEVAALLILLLGNQPEANIVKLNMTEAVYDSVAREAELLHLPKTVQLDGSSNSKITLVDVVEVG